jgi:hypothetical protein
MIFVDKFDRFVCLFLLLSSTTQIFLIYLSFFLIVTNFTACLIWFGFDWMEQVQQTNLKHNTENFWRKYWTMWNFKKINTHSHTEELKRKCNSKLNLNIDTSSHFQIDWIFLWTRSACKFNHIITQSNWNMYHWESAIDTKFEWQIESNPHIDKTSTSWIVWM